MQKYNHGLLYGRFQPFHNGHLYLIHQALKQTKTLTIGIGSANIHDENNPLTFEQRKNTIEIVIKKEGIKSKVQNIVPLNDYYDDGLWFKNTIKETKSIDVVIGNNEWTNNIFVNNKIPVLRIKYYKRILYEGLKIRKLIQKDYSWQKRVPHYLIPILTDYIKTIDQIPFRFDHVALGGTFDHFHIGHMKLIDTAFKYAKNVSIGITDDKFCKKKFLYDSIEDYQTRKQAVIRYLKEKKYDKRSTFYHLNDMYGPTLIDGTIEALVVSKQTFPNTIKINTERKKRNLPQLDNILVSDVLGQDKKLVSSERVREGKIDRNGNSYQSLVNGYLGKKKILYLPDNLREELRIPLGKVISAENNMLEKTAKKIVKSIKLLQPTMTITVGDIVSMSLLKVGFQPDLAIIDFRSRREKIKIINEDTRLNYDRSQIVIRNGKNEAGTIDYKAVEVIKIAIDNFLRQYHPQGVIIDGEEDLLALPAVLFAPLGSVVLYGQYGLGVIAVEVNEKTKRKATEILKKFRA